MRTVLSVLHIDVEFDDGCDDADNDDTENQPDGDGGDDDDDDRDDEVQNGDIPDSDLDVSDGHSTQNSDVESAKTSEEPKGTHDFSCFID